MAEFDSPSNLIAQKGAFYRMAKDSGLIWGTGGRSPLQAAVRLGGWQGGGCWGSGVGPPAVTTVLSEMTMGGGGSLRLEGLHAKYCLHVRLGRLLASRFHFWFLWKDEGGLLHPDLIWKLFTFWVMKTSGQTFSGFISCSETFSQRNFGWSADGARFQTRFWMYTYRNGASNTNNHTTKPQTHKPLVKCVRHISLAVQHSLFILCWFSVALSWALKAFRVKTAFRKQPCSGFIIKALIFRKCSRKLMFEH